MQTQAALCVLLCFVGNAAAEHYAVLVAGSSGYGNYRHQADVAHSYRVMREYGVKAENIITMMVDDVANNAENPFKGKLFNRPGNNQTDYYEGLVIDWKGKDVTPDNFAKILEGSSDGAVGKQGKVLTSTKEDNVFVYFCDHGGVGIIGFPETTMHANALISALKTSYENGRFKQMVFYLEACESGSMFQNLLPKDLPIFAVTAANAKESSWGTYCSPKDEVDGKHIGSCLGDLFSVNWMQDTEGTLGGAPQGPARKLLGGGGGGCEGNYGSKVGDPVCCGQPGTIDKASEICPQSAPNCTGYVMGIITGTCGAPPPPPPPPPGPQGINTTLQTQFNNVKAATVKSHVLEFGQVDWAATKKVGDFQGAVGAFFGMPTDRSIASEQEKLESAVSSRDIPLFLAQERYNRTHSEEDRQKLEREIRSLKLTEALETRLIKQVTGEGETAKLLSAAPITSIQPFAACHQGATETFGTTCGFNEGNLKLAATLFRMCEFSQGETSAVQKAVWTVCSSQN